MLEANPGMTEAQARAMMEGFLPSLSRWRVAGAVPFLGMGVWAWGQGLRASGPGGRRRFAGP